MNANYKKTKLARTNLHKHNGNFSIKKLLQGFTKTQKNEGFTLIELIVVIVMIGILSAIAAPSWLGFLNRQRLNKAYDGVVSALQQAQTEAKKKKLSYSASFRVNNGIPEYAIYTGTTLPTSGWNSLGSELKGNKVLVYTNLTAANTRTTDGNIVLTAPGSGTISFDYMGALARKTDGTDADTPLKVMLAIPITGNQAGGLKRCAIVDTLLGGMRTAKDNDCT